MLRDMRIFLEGNGKPMKALKKEWELHECMHAIHAYLCPMVLGLWNGKELKEMWKHNLLSQTTVSAKSKVLLAHRLCEGRKPVMPLVCATEQTNVDEQIHSSYSGCLLGEFVIEPFLWEILFQRHDFLGGRFRFLQRKLCNRYGFFICCLTAQISIWLTEFIVINLVKKQFLTLEYQADHLLD